MQIEIEHPTYIAPKEMSTYLQSLLAEKSDEMQFPYCTIHSGAGHDSMVLSDTIDVGMLFIPSKDGLSHCPEEWSDDNDIARSVDILYETVKELIGC